MVEKEMQKGWQNCPKWSQNGVLNRLKINPQIIQKIDAKKGAFSGTFSVNGKSLKLPTIQQDYLQAVYLNITYLNKTKLFGHSSGKEHVNEGGN